MKSALLLLFAALSVPAFAVGADAVDLYDFDAPASSGSWRSVNDDVMGGVSRGEFAVEDGRLVFSGRLSLANNGGFASIRTKRGSRDLSAFDAVVIRVRGDGRRYTMNIGTDAWIPAGSYWSTFKTSGEWQELRLPFSTFTATAFGRPYALAPRFNPARIRTIGITIADKKAGPFRIEVDRIRAVKGAAEQPRAPLPTSPGSLDIVAVAADAGSFKTLLAAAKAAGLVETLKGDGPLTVFAPTDDAFGKLPDGTVKELLLPENNERLASILKYHVVPGRVLLGGRTLKTVLGQTVEIGTGKSLTVNNAGIVKANIAASNGVIHVIDAVLLPKPAVPGPRAAAARLIELAIRRGVPLFNDGNPAACAAVYEVTATGLLEQPGDVIGKGSRAALTAALATVADEDDPKENAWTLRRALDTVYADLKREH